MGVPNKQMEKDTWDKDKIDIQDAETEDEDDDDKKKDERYNELKLG